LFCILSMQHSFMYLYFGDYVFYGESFVRWKSRGKILCKC
jgi:hypothetical protein